MAFQILTVCSGNVCRSPMAAQLIRAGLAGLADVSVGSAGTVAMVGEPMDVPARVIAERLGATDADLHVARQLDADLIRRADLVLGLSREHRRAVVELVPRSTRSTFTLREFAALAASVTDTRLENAMGVTATHEAGVAPGDVASRLRRAVVVVAGQRGIAPPFGSPEDADVVDPYRRSEAVYEESASQLRPAVDATVGLLLRAAGVRSGATPD